MKLKSNCILQRFFGPATTESNSWMNLLIKLEAKCFSRFALHVIFARYLIFAHVHTKQIFEINIASYDVARTVARTISPKYNVLFMLH